MSESPEPNEQVKVEVMESLLDALYENQREHSDLLVSKGMQQLEAEQLEKPESKKSLGFPWLSWSVVAAAIVAIVFLFPTFGGSDRAMATIDSTIEQAIRDVGRHYEVLAVFRTSNGVSSKRNADLFVKGGDRFAVSSKGPLGISNSWLGSYEGKGWVVPPIGPVLVGETSNLVSWVSQREDIATPYLHISTILERMRDNYRLELLEDESIQVNGDEVRCQHLVGELKEPVNNLPSRIELWADLKSKVAMRVIADWKLTEGVAGREKLVVEFLEEKALADDFFTPEFHDKNNRPRINFN